MILIIALFLSSCTTSSLTMEVLIPAQINVPQDVKKVVILNRSLPDKKGQWLNLMEGFITGESIMADIEGSDHCTESLYNKLKDAPRFDPILVREHILFGTGTRQFPTPLSWDKVNDLCSQYNADGLVVLETFDSDINIDRGFKEKKKKITENKIEKEITYIEHFADLNINVNAGWRIYDIKNRMIVDDNSYMDNQHWHTTAEKPQDAIAKLPSKRAAINDAGNYSGIRYALRISPSWQRIMREYYINKHDDFKLADNYVKTQQWDKAIDIWKKLAVNNDPKIAFRGCFNMAVGAEYQGRIDIALQWAQKASNINYNSRVREYINILNQRITDLDRLKEQMGK
ncbi:MAG: DUF6340 family protein [Bacteroidota bacterium]|nr:DUF6340 family protein [Bacteroidota bacterium]